MIHRTWSTEGEPHTDRRTETANRAGITLNQRPATLIARLGRLLGDRQEGRRSLDGRPKTHSCATASAWSGAAAQQTPDGGHNGWRGLTHVGAAAGSS